ncbi:MAG: cation-translocating P-type ATPase, partial [Gammaproteobacteria bacterium]|nr:cation-translocating P-type ATPase [Gammaproteobacteria bacterium]
GDGLNDAGAMATADISLAVNPVDTVVQSAADATLVSGDLSAIPELFDYAERVQRIIRQNLCWALAYNLSVIPLAMMGLVAPWIAALGMSMSSLLVTLNACRLARTSQLGLGQS